MNERDAFADEQGYIAHRRHEASMARAERLRRLAALPLSAKERETAKRHNAIYTRIKSMLRSRKWRASHPNWMREYRVRNRDRLLVQQRLYNQTHREQRREYQCRHHAERLLQQAVRRRENRDQYNTMQREYRQANKERLNEKERARYSAMPPESKRAYNKRKWAQRVARNTTRQRQKSA